MTYKEIEEKYGIKYGILTDRVRFLEIKGRFKSKKLNFTKNQVEQIINYTPKRQIKKQRKQNHPRKLKIIEFYLKLKSGRQVAEFLNMDRKVIYSAIKEYDETGCVVVESKMNYLIL